MNDTTETTQTLDRPETAAAKPASTPRTSAAPPTDHHSVRHLADDHDEDEGFFERHRVKLIAVAVVVIGGGITYAAMTADKTPARKAPEKIVQITTLPPLPPPVAPPPPPPPPKVEPLQKDEMVELDPVEDTLQAVDEPPEDDQVGTVIKGDGPGELAFGPGGKGGPGKIGGIGGEGADELAVYAGRVQGSVADRLRNNSATKSATINLVTVRIWVDTTGRVTNATLASSTGQPEVDRGIIDALRGAQVGVPPAKMRMPIVMEVTAKRS